MTDERLPKQAIIEFQKLWKKEFNEDLSLEDAEHKAEDLLSLYVKSIDT